jgi:hypothetical protein
MSRYDELIASGAEAIDAESTPEGYSGALVTATEVYPYSGYANQEPQVGAPLSHADFLARYGELPMMSAIVARIRALAAR